MSSQPKIDRVVFHNGVKMCWCSYEHQYKPCDEFSPRKEQHGYQYYCRTCAAEISKNGLVPNIPIYVREGANELLERIGYDLDSNLTIHQQFLQKHKINERV